MALLFRIFNFQVCRALCRQQSECFKASTPIPHVFLNATRRDAERTADAVLSPAFRAYEVPY